mmetsp:Transcript_7155/g.12328  ORF Transcript_7155/g.12328 Transcript_7155/m.12328 type:complete len:648 (-) Transcript_7155:73-2016(-)
MEVARKPRDRCQEATPPDPGMSPLWLTLKMENIRLQDEIKEVKKALQIASARNSRGIFAAQRFHGEKQTTEALLGEKQTTEALLLSIRDGVDKLRESQDGHEQRLLAIIQEEFQRLRASSVSDKQMPAEKPLPLDVKLAHTYRPQTPHESGSVETIVSVDDNLPQKDLDKHTVPTSNALPQAAGDAKKNTQWDHFQTATQNLNQKNLFRDVVEDNMRHKSMVQKLFQYFEIHDFLPQDGPNTEFARATAHPLFFSFSTFLILASAGLMGVEADFAIDAAMQTPKGDLPNWLPAVNFILTIAFAVEVVLRLVALRAWFWVAPYEWGWNVFDFTVVVISIVSEILGGMNFGLLRALRISRAIRAVRIIRIFRFFRELRKMLFAILACLRSLFWFLTFLVLVIFMFAILFLQGFVSAINDMDQDELILARGHIDKWYGGIGKTMFSLLVAVTGGQDWMDIRKPLVDYAGFPYDEAFLLYVIFVTVGIMNVLTGVFLANANNFIDHSMIIQEEQFKIDAFVKQMLELFSEMDILRVGYFTWQTFNAAMREESVQACFAAHELEPTHCHLLFDLLDDNGNGEVSILEFVMGMLRLKGEAKCLDVRVLQREMGMLPKMLVQELAQTGVLCFAPPDASPQAGRNDVPESESAGA